MGIVEKARKRRNFVSNLYSATRRMHFYVSTHNFRRAGRRCTFILALRSNGTHDAARTVALSQTYLPHYYPVRCRRRSFLVPGTHLSKASSPQTDDNHAAMFRTTYREVVGSLIYLVINTRPDIVFAANQLSRFLDCYGKVHCSGRPPNASSVISKVLVPSSVLCGENIVRLIGYTDSDFAGCPDTRCASVSMTDNFPPPRRYYERLYRRILYHGPFR